MTSSELSPGGFATSPRDPADCSRRAVIDIGTNSVKLLVADIHAGNVTPLVEKSEQTRLGSGFYETHRLQADPIEKTALAVARFASESTELRVESTRVIATSAARDALNCSELLDAIRRTSGLEVDVISGEREADWVFRGVTTDARLLEHPLLILDVGGGSSEFILGQGFVQKFRESFHLGTVRLLERFHVSDPPLQSEWSACRLWLGEFINSHVSPVLTPRISDFASGSIQLVGTGGTTTILGRMQLQMETFDRGALDSLRLSREDVCRHTERLWQLPLEERRTIPGLPASRADVILAGSAIFAAVMEYFEFADLCVSTRGLRFAAVLDG